MKYAYTPKMGNVINSNGSTTRYFCEAYEYFKNKRKDDLTEIISEINRRESEKFHLPKL